jgi:3-oxoacyl-[acyl-carrier protein] reductase
MHEGVVWLTGCASGLGLHLARCFVDRGWRVAATDINIEGLERIAARQSWNPKRVMVRRQDVVSLSDWEILSEQVMDAWGRLDLMFNIAGYVRAGWLVETPIEEMARHMDVNFGGVVMGSRIAAGHMKKQGYGHIVNVSSLAGVAPIPGLGFYSASKFAVRAFSRALADELFSAGVYVTVICPDAIETPMLVGEQSHEEAALTFSGPKPLSVDDVERVVFDRVLRKKPVEVLIPAMRGLQARLASLFPRLARVMIGRLRKKGLKEQQRRMRDEGRGPRGGNP